MGRYRKEILTKGITSISTSGDQPNIMFRVDEIVDGPSTIMDREVRNKITYEELAWLLGSVKAIHLENRDEFMIIKKAADLLRELQVRHGR